MTAREFNAAVQSDIATRIAAEPILAPCVCGTTDTEPDLGFVHPFGDARFVTCDACDREVVAPTKTEVIKLWNAAMRHDAIEAERAAWQKEAAMLLKACEDALWHTDGHEDVDDGSDGQPVPNVFMKIAGVLREAISKATKRS